MWSVGVYTAGNRAGLNRPPTDTTAPKLNTAFNRLLQEWVLKPGKELLHSSGTVSRFIWLIQALRLLFYNMKSISKFSALWFLSLLWKNPIIKRAEGDANLWVYSNQTQIGDTWNGYTQTKIILVSFIFICFCQVYIQCVSQWDKKANKFKTGWWG